MNNKTNIYDIDGELIRAAGDNHKFTIDEAQEKLKYYVEKLKQLDKTDNDYVLKLSVYNQYVNNLANYIIRERALRGDFSKKAGETPNKEENEEAVISPQIRVTDEEGNDVEVIEE